MASFQGWDLDQTQAVIREIQEGSPGAWHRFVESYSGLIHAVVRRYLAFGSEDDRRDLFVEILEKLHQGALQRYDGRSRLSTWLFIFSRSRCLDWLRSTRGRRALPKWLTQMPERDQRVFRLYYVDGLGSATIREILTNEGMPTTLDDLVDSLDRLDAKLDKGMRQRLASDLFAHSIGFTSGRLLDFLYRLRVDYESQNDPYNPEADLLRKELAVAAEKVREYVERLPELERRVISMRFYEGRTARESFKELGLEDQREVYTVENRAIRLLRSMFRT